MRLFDWIKKIWNMKLIPRSRKVVPFSLAIAVVAGLGFSFFWNLLKDPICQKLGIGEVFFYIIGRTSAGVIGALVWLTGFLILNDLVGPSPESENLKTKIKLKRKNDQH